MIYPRRLSSWGPSELKNLNLIFDKIIRYLEDTKWGSGYFQDIEVTDTGTADTDFTVDHKLGYTPSGWLLYYQDKSGTLYLVSWNDSQATFRFSNDNAHIKFRLF